MRTGRCSILFALGLWVLSGRALAQPSAENEARALSLFKDAVADAEKGDYTAACPKFDAAMKLFPSPGTGLNIAKCIELSGKVASARGAYYRVLILSRDMTQAERRAAVETIANDAVSRLEARLPKVRVIVETAPPGLTVTEDGQDLPVSSFGVALPVDPGTRSIVAVAPGYETATQQVTAIEGETSDVHVVLKPLPHSPELTVIAPPASTDGDARTKSTGPPAMPERSKQATSKPLPQGGIPPWAWIAGGAGIALGVASAAFWIDWGKIDTKQEAAGCGVDLDRCPQTYAGLGSDNAKKERDRALFFGLGAAGIAGMGFGAVGIVSGLLKKDASGSASVRAAPWIGRDIAGFGFNGLY